MYIFFKDQIKFLLAIAVTICASNVSAESSRFYGNLTFSTSLTLNSSVDAHRHYTAVEMVDKRAPFKYEIIFGRADESTSANPNHNFGSLSATYLMNPQVEFGAILEKDDFQKTDKKGITFALNTKTNDKSQAIIPYAYGALGQKKIIGGPSANFFQGYMGVRKQTNRIGLFGGVDFDKVSWRDGVMSDSMSILFKPRLQYFFDNSDANAITLWGEFGSVNESLNPDSKVYTYGLSLDYLLASEIKLNTQVFNKKQIFNNNNKKKDIGVALNLIKYF